MALLLFISYLGFSEEGNNTPFNTNGLKQIHEDSSHTFTDFYKNLVTPRLCERSDKPVWYFNNDAPFYSVNAFTYNVAGREIINDFQNGSTIPDCYFAGDSVHITFSATHFNGETIHFTHKLVVENCSADTNECTEPALPNIADTLSVCDSVILLSREFPGLYAFGDLVEYDGTGSINLIPRRATNDLFRIYLTEVIYENSCGDSLSKTYETFITDSSCGTDSCKSPLITEIPDTIASCDGSVLLGSGMGVMAYGELVEVNIAGDVFLNPSLASRPNTHFETFVFTNTFCGLDSTVHQVFVTDKGCGLDSCETPVFPDIADTLSVCDSGFVIGNTLNGDRAFGYLVSHENFNGDITLNPSNAINEVNSHFETFLIYENGCGDTLERTYFTFINDVGCGVDTTIIDSNIVIVDDCISPFEDYNWGKFPDTIANCDNPLHQHWGDLLEFHSTGCNSNSGKYDVSHLKAGYVDQITYSYLNVCGDTVRKEQSILITDCETACDLENVKEEVMLSVPSEMCLTQGGIKVSTKNLRVINSVDGLGLGYESGEQWLFPSSFVDGDEVVLEYLGAHPGCTDSVYFQYGVNISDCVISGVDGLDYVELNVFPNPVRNIINLDSKLSLTSVKIYDLSGKVVLEGASNSLNTSDLEIGFYFIEAKDIAGNIYKQKIMKE